MYSAEEEREAIIVIKEIASQGKLTELVKHYRAEDDQKMRKFYEDGMIRGIEACEKRVQIERPARLLKIKGLPDSVMTKAVECCGRNRWISAIVGLLKQSGLSDAVINSGIENLTLRDIVGLLKENRRLPDAVLIRGIEVLAKNGFITTIASLLEKKNLSSTAKEAIEKGLIEGIEACGSGGWKENIVALLKKDILLPDAVKKAAEDGLHMPEDFKKSMLTAGNKGVIPPEHPEQVLSQCIGGSTPLSDGTMQSAKSAFKIRNIWDNRGPFGIPRMTSWRGKNKIARKV